jgi:hypothetical protein
LRICIQESEGSEGESEYDDGANNEEDELISDGGQEQEAVSHGVGTSGKAHLVDLVLCFSGSKQQSNVTGEAIASAADGSATAEKTEAQSGGRKVTREEAGDGQGQSARSSLLLLAFFSY